MERKILRLPEVAEMTNIPLATLRDWRHHGDKGPPTWKLGGRVVAYADEVQAWIDEQHASARDAS
jgi:predicted DNA-binding transcriptional regulator AlpA